MTVGGRPVTWIQLLPNLLTLAGNVDFYRTSVWRCRCRAGACLRVPDRDLPGGAWSACPYGLLRHPLYQQAQLLHDSARVSPLAGWPDAYPAWLSVALLALQKRKEARA